MKLPIETDIPLEVLEASPVVYLDLIGTAPHGHSNVYTRLAGALGTHTITMWMLLLHSNAEVRKWKNFGTRTHRLLTELLEEHGLYLNAFPALANELCTASGERRVGAAISTLLLWDGVNEDVRASLVAAGFRVGMTARKLFVNPTAARPPLTPEQVEFLRQPVSAIITDLSDGAWMVTATCRLVIHVALLIVHMQDEQVDNGAVPRMRTQIEKVVGPLPLQLTLAELEQLMA